MEPQRTFDLAPGLGGFVVGAVVAIMAAVAIVPADSRGDGQPVVVQLGEGADGGVVVSQPGQDGDGSVEGDGGDTPFDGLAQVAPGPQGGQDDGATAGSSPDGSPTNGPRPDGASSSNPASSSSDASGSSPADPGDSSTGGGEDSSSTGGGGSSSSTGQQSGGGVEVGGGDGGGSGGIQSGGSGSGDGGSECRAEANGGATDVGVTGTEIKLGATVAESGIAQSFLGEVRQAMEAVRNTVNREGGVCGRQLKIIYKEDGWSAETGARFIENLVEGEKVFALAVVPSSEGLNQKSLSGYFEREGVPVVGSDGMIRTQYTDPYIWPVAAATVTTLHVMMKDAWDRGARYPAIVYENTYRFGVEGAFAFNQAFRRLSGDDIPGYQNPLSGSGGTCNQGSRFCGIPAGQGQYGNQVSTINAACNSEPKCDYMVLLLEPKTAQDWMAAPGVRPASFYNYGTGAAQPLFTFDFAQTCRDLCGGMWIWTGYNPPIEGYANAPAVRRYVEQLHEQSSSADEFNQFTEGGYLGMLLVVEALERVGPNLTRADLVEVLDAMDLDTGLSPPLSWRRGNHFANKAAQAFEVRSNQGFNGWRLVRNYLVDPWLGEDMG